mgnify:CR=1 FL=1
MLDRGFTTVRDTGGCDWGIKTAVEQGYLVGPRLFIAGQSIGPTGGHCRWTPAHGCRGAGCSCCNGLAVQVGGRRRHPIRCARPPASRCARAPTM